MTDYDIGQLVTHLNRAGLIAQEYPELSDVWDLIEQAVWTLDQMEFETKPE